MTDLEIIARFQELRADKASLAGPAVYDWQHEDEFLELLPKYQRAREIVTTEEQAAEKRREKLKRVSATPVVPFPREWLDDGRWAKLGSAGAKVAPAIVALVEKDWDHVPLGLIVELSGASLSTVKRGIDECEAAGLIGKITKKLFATDRKRMAVLFKIHRSQK